MPLGTAYPFGLRDVKIKPMTDPALETLGAALDLPASRTMTCTESESYEELRGDDKIITSRGMGASVDWDLEGGGVSFDILKALVGGVLTDTGVTPNQVRKLAKKATDSRPFFRMEGQVMSDNGGDVHMVLYRCRATGDVEYNFADGEWFLTQCSGQAFPSQAVGTVDALYDLIYNETITAIA